ncbi:hypothetical protein R3P38DRAFT_2772591 [Favolaschia claudopus]|uniref:Uncharacterized protein n=1 Tax=Favolaschia claudopus TaxID=2862362 RepID=A0AAW0C481_9AGAR
MPTCAGDARYEYPHHPRSQTVISSYRAVEDEETSTQTSPPSLRNGLPSTTRTASAMTMHYRPPVSSAPSHLRNEPPPPSTCHDEDKAAAAMSRSSLVSGDVSLFAITSASAALQGRPRGDARCTRTILVLRADTNANEHDHGLPPSSTHNDEDEGSALPLPCTPHSSFQPPHSDPDPARGTRRKAIVAVQISPEPSKTRRPSPNEPPLPSRCPDEDKGSVDALLLPRQRQRISHPHAHAQTHPVNLIFHNGPLAPPPSTCHDEDGANVLSLPCTPHSPTAVPPPHSGNPGSPRKEEERKQRQLALGGVGKEQVEQHMQYTLHAWGRALREEEQEGVAEAVSVRGLASFKLWRVAARRVVTRWTVYYFGKRSAVAASILSIIPVSRSLGRVAGAERRTPGGSRPSPGGRRKMFGFVVQSIPAKAQVNNLDLSSQSSILQAILCLANESGNFSRTVRKGATLVSEYSYNNTYPDRLGDRKVHWVFEVSKKLQESY